jgi:hypothetical protein
LESGDFGSLGFAPGEGPGKVGAPLAGSALLPPASLDALACLTSLGAGEALFPSVGSCEADLALECRVSPPSANGSLAAPVEGGSVTPRGLSVDFEESPAGPSPAIGVGLTTPTRDAEDESLADAGSPNGSVLGGLVVEATASCAGVADGCVGSLGAVSAGVVLA